MTTPPKIFITGATGYIGGSILSSLTQHFPHASITALLRSPPPSFSTLYPNVRIVKGIYDSTSLITTEAANADVIIHNGDSDHVGSLTALIDGLLAKEKRDGVKGYLLHLSGTGIVADWQDEGSLGTLNHKVWSDESESDISTIRNLPHTALHRATERVICDAIASHADKINLAIMCPPDIYGQGTGPGKKHSALIPMFVKQSVERGRVFMHADGTNTRSWVHIDDLVRLYMRLVSVAVEPSLDADAKAAYFNENGYYFAATQELSQHELAQKVGEILKSRGLVSTAEPQSVSLEELDAMPNVYPAFPKLARYLYASNSRSRADRAERLFGYKGEAPGLMESLEQDVVDAIESVKKEND